jgi:FtsP/CotA-like multicopper oxidase with cupredoxin domain
MSDRRTFIQRALGAGAALFAARGLSAQEMQMNMPMGPDGDAPSATHQLRDRRSKQAVPAFNMPVVTTDVGDLPYTVEGGAKVFHLTAEVLKREVTPGKTIDVWGFSGSAPGPTIQVNQGDHVRVVFDNHLPEPTSVHWHGFEDQIHYDGQPGISQEAVKPGGRFIYEFDIHQEGTYFYHSHMAMQEMAGMLGGFIMHPKNPYRPHCDKDFLIHLQEYAVLPSNTVPNTMNMEFNWLVLNGKAGPAATPLIVRAGDRVRIRFVNLGMDHHPMHMHGHTFYVTGTEGGRIPEAAWWPGNTVLVGVAQARSVEFMANNPGDWMLHCHLPHHMMNQMSSNVGKMTRAPRSGQPAGVDMNTGMGMLQGVPVVPMGDDYGTSLGRGMGFGNNLDMETSNGPLSQEKAKAAMQGMKRAGMQGMDRSQMAGMSDMGDMQADVAKNANSVPNFPQDAYMEGPMMAMDEMVMKPENYGLRAGWSGFMMGMMTFVRVLPPDKYDEVISRMKQANRSNDPYAAILSRS